MSFGLGQDSQLGAGEVTTLTNLGQGPKNSPDLVLGLIRKFSVLGVVQAQAVLLSKSMSERGGSEEERL